MSDDKKEVPIAAMRWTCNGRSDLILIKVDLGSETFASARRKIIKTFQADNTVIDWLGWFQKYDIQQTKF